MGRESGAQEVACTVALPLSLYPGLLHRKLPTSAASPVLGSTTTTSTTNAASAATAAGLGSAEPRDAHVPGVVLEVRRLWQPPSTLHTAATKSSTEAAGAPSASSFSYIVAPRASSPGLRGTAAALIENTDRLYAFVRVKDADHRLSGWFPLHQVFAKLDTALAAFGDSAVPVAGAAAAATAVADDVVPLSSLVHRPWLNGVYEEVTPGMARTQRARRQLDYLEERLLRDCRTPTTVRYFVYLNSYVFAPWYYAPFGLLNSEYDPLLRSRDDGASPSEAVNGSTTARAAVLPQSPQPFIRDAFLCPFSLRIFSTYAQLHYETRTYRADRLRPPGEEIYRDERRGLSLFKINGSQHVTYCRHLFLIGKSFLENKLAGHDVHSYYFYVVCLHHRYFPHYITDTSALYFAGFFTWEKHVEEYNLACIATLPCFGRRAAPRRPLAPPPKPSSQGGGVTADDGAPPPVLRNIGQFMIAVSYELAYRRKQIGTPEKPLSDLGAVAYQHYWRRVLVRWMKSAIAAMRRATAVDVEEEEVGSGGGNGGGGATPEPRREALSPAEDLVDVVAVLEVGGDSGAKALRGGQRKRTRTDAAIVDEGEGVSEDDGGLAGPGTELQQTSATARGKAMRGTTAASAVTATATSVDTSLVSTFNTRTTIKEIAAAVRLEDADVLTTLVGLGVLHRSSEDRSIQLLLPQRYVDWMYDEMLRWEASLEHAVFRPALLRSRWPAR